MSSHAEMPHAQGSPDIESGGNGTQPDGETQPRTSARVRLQRMVREIIREHYLCIVLVWLLLVLALAISTFVTFIEMLIVFRRHHEDPCDVPLDIFVWINIVTFLYHNTLHLCVQRCLGYDPAMYNTDEPVPESVARYEAAVQLWSFALCIAGVVLVCEADTCQDTAPELYRAVARFVWSGFTLAIACIITSLSTAIFVLLLRRGAITTSDAAPLGTLDRCRVIRLDKPGGLTSEDAKLLAPSDDGEEVACPICMEAFGPDKEIRLTPCRHVFHGQCLNGWLNVSRCCPMCRQDFTIALQSAPPAIFQPPPPQILPDPTSEPMSQPVPASQRVSLPASQLQGAHPPPSSGQSLPGQSPEPRAGRLGIPSENGQGQADGLGAGPGASGPVSTEGSGASGPISTEGPGAPGSISAEGLPGALSGSAQPMIPAEGQPSEAQQSLPRSASFSEDLIASPVQVDSPALPRSLEGVGSSSVAGPGGVPPSGQTPSSPPLRDPPAAGGSEETSSASSTESAQEEQRGLLGERNR